MLCGVRILALVLLSLVAVAAATGCYDSTQSRPRSSNAVHDRQTEYGSEGGDSNSHATPIEGGKGERGVNPKTGKP
jgi:hypothetical protein